MHPSLRRAFSAVSLVALIAPGLASAATYVSAYDLTVAGAPLRIMPGSQYESVTVGENDLKVTLAAGQTLVLRALGGNPRALENDAGQPICNVLVNRDNQMVLNGPVTATVTPSTSACSTVDHSDDRTPFVEIVSPNGGSTHESGSQVQVFWSNSGNAAPGVSIYLSVDGGATWPTRIADNVINTGFHSWTVPDMPSASKARFRIDGIEQGRVVAIDVSDADFSIKGTSPEPVAPVAPPAGPAVPSFDPAAATLAAATIDIDRGFVPPLVVAEGSVECAAGARIKGTSSAAVYYCGRDGMRHAFPNQRIHDSWYQGFAGVVTLTDAELAAIPLGKSVTYRPGVRMVKIQTDPKVYAVDANGTLRWVPDEWTAIRLYGADWNRLIDDVPDSFFADYAVGASVSTGN